MMPLTRTTRSALRSLTTSLLWLAMVMLVAEAQESPIDGSHSFSVSECTGQDAWFYYERCDGNNITLVYGNCANATETEETYSCAGYIVGEVFPYCHECGGRAVCSDHANEETVCADVEAERCEAPSDIGGGTKPESNSTSYGFWVFPQASETTIGSSYLVCLDGNVENRNLGRADPFSFYSCEELYSATTPYYLRCAGGVDFCISSATTTTCSDLGLEEVSTSLAYEPHFEPCPVTEGIVADVYYEQCIGNHTILQIYGTCQNPSALSESCTEWSGLPSFYYCHECVGKHICSDNPSTELVCAAVEQGDCISPDDDDDGSSSVINKQASSSPSVNYLVSDFPCIDDSSYLLINRLCLNGTVTEYNTYSDIQAGEPPVTVACPELNPATSVCLNCAGTFGVLDACVSDGVTCSDLGTPIGYEEDDLETTVENDKTAPPGLVTNTAPPGLVTGKSPPSSGDSTDKSLDTTRSSAVGTRGFFFPGAFICALAGVFLSV